MKEEIILKKRECSTGHYKEEEVESGKHYSNL
jgi:hypothetical protein